MEDEGAQLNPFGEALWRVMQDNGVESPEELAEVLRQHGHEVDVQELKMWMYGEPEFFGSSRTAGSAKGKESCVRF